WRRDCSGNRHERRVLAAGRCWTVEDRLAGPFRQVALRWRLCPGAWRLTDDGVAGPAATLRVTADAPLSLRLAEGWESPAYGALRAVPVLVVTAAAPVSRIVTAVMLPPAGRQEDLSDAA
ncbi:MAG: heparinase II/III-family protein, partial [Acetobacteraceae bacterium]|nr:heparinase II/III-family protein [Acetobacteraceae bacterium]